MAPNPTVRDFDKAVNSQLLNALLSRDFKLNGRSGIAELGVPGAAGALALGLGGPKAGIATHAAAVKAPLVAKEAAYMASPFSPSMFSGSPDRWTQFERDLMKQMIDVGRAGARVQKSPSKVVIEDITGNAKSRSGLRPSAVVPTENLYNSYHKLSQRQVSKTMPRRKIKMSPRLGKLVEANAPVSRSIAVKPRPYRYNGAKSICISHREFIGNVVSSGTTFNVESFLNLQPGDSASFPWLSPLAGRFEQYKVKAFRVMYIPTVPSSSTGTVMLAFDKMPRVLNPPQNYKC